MEVKLEEDLLEQVGGISSELRAIGYLASKMSNSEYDIVRSNVAKSKQLTDSMIKKLAVDENEGVRSNLKRNKSVPKSIREKIEVPDDVECG